MGILTFRGAFLENPVFHIRPSEVIFDLERSETCLLDSENGFLDSENGFLDLENSLLEFGILKLKAKRPQSGEVRGRISAYTHINSEGGNSAAAPPQLRGSSAAASPGPTWVDPGN